MMTTPNSLVIKLSGEALAEHDPPMKASPRAAAAPLRRPQTVDGSVLETVAAQIARLVDEGVRCGIVIGGGNIMRGNQDLGSSGMPEGTQDDAGMLATGMNAILLAGKLQQLGTQATVIAKPGICSSLALPWDSQVLADPARRALIVAGGTGQRRVSTDVAAPMLANDMGADSIVMWKHNIRFIYTSDPHTPHKSGPAPRRLHHLTTTQALDLNLKVMDRLALELCDQLGITVHVVGAQEPDSIHRARQGERIGSLMTPSTRPTRTTPGTSNAAPASRHHGAKVALRA